jgi:hypothetical protein
VIHFSDIKERLKGRTIAFIGSRDYPLLDLVERDVRATYVTDVIVSGGADGVDTVAIAAAETRGQFFIEIPVPKKAWDNLGKKAGHRRNRIIEAVSEEVQAYWSQTEKSRGTLGCLELFLCSAKEVRLFGASGQELDPCEVVNNPKQYIL